MTTLDPRTLIFAITVGNLLMGGGLLAVTRGHLGEIPGASRWAWATLIQALGWLLIGTLRGVIPEVVSVVVGQFFIQLSLTLYLTVLHEFDARRPNVAWLYAVLLGEAALLAFFTAIDRDLRARQVVISACVTLVALRSAHVLRSGSDRRVASHVFMAAVFAVCGATLAARGLIALVEIGTGREATYADSLFNGVWFLAFYIIATVLTFGFVLMCSDRYVQRRQQAEEALKSAALVDSLTQLPNRAMVTDRLRQLLADSSDHPDAVYGVLFIDLDHFKYVNDSLGHKAGDQLLVETAGRLMRVVRQDDVVLREHEVLAGRFGGDEFVVVLNQIGRPEDTVRVAERILDAMAKPFQLNGQSVSVHCSIGISTNRGRYAAMEDLLRDADTAMYQAKAAGRANYVVFDESMHLNARRRLRVENDLRAAIERDQIKAFYQPIIDLTTGRVAAFEALARWHHPERGLIAPDEFIPMAEETGLIVQVGQIIMEQAAATMERMSRLPGGAAIRMNVNVSRRQLIDGRFATCVRAVVDQLSVAPERLCLELTETAVSGSSPLIPDMLHELKALGVQIHLDDFGAGLSSLSLLRTLPLDGMKVDRSFIDAANGDAQAIAILSAIISLGRSLGKTITVEGISDRQQIATVLALDCDLGQGYLFGRPMPAEAAEAVLGADFSSYCAAA